MRHTLKYVTFGLIFAGLTFAQTTAPSPTTMVQREVARLTKQLTLNAGQQAQATTIFTTEATANQPIMASLKTARTSLAAAVTSNNTAEIATLAGQIGTMEGQLLTNSSTARASLYAILSPTQQSEFTAHGGHGFGGPGSAFRGHGGFGQ